MFNIKEVELIQEFNFELSIVILDLLKEYNIDTTYLSKVEKYNILNKFINKIGGTNKIVNLMCLTEYENKNLFSIQKHISNNNIRVISINYCSEKNKIKTYTPLFKIEFLGFKKEIQDCFNITYLYW